MTDFVNSSALTKLLANVFIFAVLSAMLAIGIFDTLNHIPIPDYITTAVGAALGYGLTLLGVHVGSTTATHMSEPVPATAPLPALEEQKPPA